MSEGIVTSPRPDKEGRFLPVPSGMLTDDEYNGYWRMSKALAAGRMFKDVSQAEQAFSKMVLGHYLGMNPAQSMTGIQLVRGNVMFSYPTLGAFIRTRPGYDYKILEHTNEAAEIEFFHDGESLGTARFTIEDAKRAKLIKDGGGWETYPENMCVARALSKGTRFFMPEALGGIPVYVEGEVPPVAELTDGEGTGELVGVALPPEVEEVIAEAERLGHARLSERSVWEYWVGSPSIDIDAKIREAKDDLADLKRRREAEEDQEAQVEPDLPPEVVDVDPKGDHRPGENALWMKDIPHGRTLDNEQSEEGGLATEADNPLVGEEASSVAKDSATEPVAQDLGEGEGSSGPGSPSPENDLEQLRARRKLYGELEATTPEEQEDKDKLLDDLDQKILELSQAEADENPDQLGLI